MGLSVQDEHLERTYKIYHHKIAKNTLGICASEEFCPERSGSGLI